MSNGTTQHIPADVRELVAREVFALDDSPRREYWDQFRRDFPRQAQVYYDTADRILAILRTPRGEGEAAAMSANLARALAAMQAAWIEWRRGRGADAAMQWIENTLIGPGLIPGDDESDAQAFFDCAIAEIENHQIRHAAALLSTPRGDEEAWRAFLDAVDEVETEAASLWADPEGPTGEDMERLDRARQRVIECGRALAGIGCTEDDARRSEADALDLIRWAESQGAALEPVAGNIMPPGTYACYAGDADDPYMGPGILGAIRAARRSEGGGA